MARAPRPANCIQGMTLGCKYEPLLAVLCGAGFTALIALLLNIPSPIVLPLSLLLLPGSAFSALVFHTKELGSPIAVLVFSAIVYSLIFYLVLRRRSGFVSDKTKLATQILAVPVIVVASLACIPSMSPIWPQGMEELEAREKKLRDGLPASLSIESARSFLQKQGVPTSEELARNDEVVVQVADKKITAGAGDTVISGQVLTDAMQFPCGFRIDVILVFGNDARLRQEHISRFRLCP